MIRHRSVRHFSSSKLVLNVFFPAFAEPLYIRFSENSSDQHLAAEKTREAEWKSHFSIFGRGSSMYRTSELYELLLQGIPNSFRNELWAIFSGAAHEVRLFFSRRRKLFSSNRRFFFFF